MATGASHDEYVRTALSWRPPSDARALPEAELSRIDVAPYLRGDPGALDALARELRAALSGPGFFVMVNTDVDAAPVLDAARRFHALPAAVKQRYDLLRHRRRMGYAPLGGKVQATSHRPTKNRQDLFNVTVWSARDPRRAQGFDDNNWPTEADCAGFRSAMQGHMEALHRLCHALLPAVAAALDSPAEELVGLFRDATGARVVNQSCTALSYPPSPPGEGMYGIHPHLDTGFLTFVAADRPGLVVSPWDGAGGGSAAWLRAPEARSPSGARDAYYVNSGDMLKRMSNDLFKSTRHYVANPLLGEEARISVPFFFDTGMNVRCPCLSGTVSPTRPARYEPISLREYGTGYEAGGGSGYEAKPKGRPRKVAKL